MKRRVLVAWLALLAVVAAQRECKVGPPTKDKEHDTAAVKKSIVECTGGGKIMFEEGEYLLKPFNFTSGQTLYLPKGAYIHASTDAEDWPVVDPLPSYGDGREMPGRQYSAFISAWNATNVAIEGKGIIDGHGMAWWFRFYHGTLKYGRGRLIQFLYCKGVHMEGIELRYAPFWTVHLYDSSDIVVERMKIFNPVYGANTDGVDPDSSRNVLIRDMDICTGDDHVAVKSGWVYAGTHYGKPSENITVANCTFSAGFGATIGSEVAGGIRNVRVENCTFTGCTWAIKFKSGANDSSIVENIHYKNITMYGVGVGIWIEMLYRTESQEFPPVLRDISFTDVHGLAMQAGHISCLKKNGKSLCANLRLENVKLHSLLGYRCSNVEGAVAHNSYPSFCS